MHWIFREYNFDIVVNAKHNDDFKKCFSYIGLNYNSYMSCLAKQKHYFSSRYLGQKIYFSF
jgi:hypothetical protein